MTEEKAAKVNNVLVALQLLLEAIEDAEMEGIFIQKVKQNSNRLKADIEKVFNNVFKDASLIASDYYVDMIEFLKQQGIVFARIYEFSEHDKIKFLLALQNFYTINLKNK